MDPTKADLQQMLARANEAASRADYVTAEQLYRQSLDACRAKLPGDIAALVSSLDGLAEVYGEIEDFAAAEPLCKEALEIRRRHLGEGSEDVALNLEELAAIEQEMGNLAEAASLNREVLSIRMAEEDADAGAIARTLRALREIHGSMGDLAGANAFVAQAAELGRQVLAAPRPPADDANALSQLAFLCEDLGLLAEAGQILQEAVDAQREHPSDPSTLANTLRNLAGLHLTRGAYAAAQPLYREVLAMGAPDPRVHLEDLNGAAWAAYQMGDYAAARPLYQQVLDATRALHGDAAGDVARVLVDIADIALAAARPEDALAALQQAAPIEDELLEAIFAIGSEKRRAAYLAELAATQSMLLTLVSRSGAEVPAAAPLALDLVLRRKALTTEALAVQRDQVLGGRYPEAAPKLAELSALRARIARRTLAGPGAEGLDAYRRLLSDWEARREALEEALVQAIPEMSLDRTLRAATRERVAAALPAGSALVEILCFRERTKPTDTTPPRSRYVALVLHAGAPDGVAIVDLGEAAAVDALVAGYRSSVTHHAETAGEGDRHLEMSPEPEGPPAGGDALRAAVFDPFRPALGSARRIFLAPDGELCRLPFEVLPTADGQYLIDTHDFSYLTCGRDVLRLGPGAVSPAGKAGEAVVVAHPDYDLAGAPGAAPSSPPPTGGVSRDLDRGLSFSPLPETAAEGAAVAARLGVSPWLGADALEGRIAALRSPRVLHVATHGFFLPDQAPDAASTPAAATPANRLVAAGRENPLVRSGLVLAGANTWLAGGTPAAQAGDGLLTGEDVAVMDFHATELVVLSACQTALGEIKCGEGVYGLRRAFAVAGARTLVMSLWSVPDKETRLLMATFYEGLAAGLGRAGALRAAQQKVREGSPLPRSWGAFICQGEPGPLPAEVDKGGPAV